MSERVREVLHREVRLILANLRTVPDTNHETIVRLSPQTVLYSLALIDRVAESIGGRSRRLVKEMRDVRALAARDLELKREWSSDGKPPAVIRTAAS